MISQKDLKDEHMLYRPVILCDYLVKKVNENKEEFMEKLDEFSNIYDTDTHGGFPVYNMINALRFVFIPTDVMEEKIIHDNVVDGLENIKNLFTTYEKTLSIEDMIAKYGNRLMNTYDNLSDIWLDVSNIVFVFNREDDDKLVDVHTTIPGNLLNFLKHTKYSCKSCGYQFETDNNDLNMYIPKMYYTYDAVENKVDYYCPDCTRQLLSSGTSHKICHVGDDKQIIKVEYDKVP
jgi:predicted RNA-binding Zn-ribbon protein involved in translation (DUF1610 family)